MNAILKLLLSKRRTGFSSPVICAITLLSTLLIWPHDAMAQAITLGVIMCNVVDNITPLAWLMNGIAYIGGAIFIGSGLLLFIKNRDNPGNTPLHQPIARVVAGACLLFLPSTISLFINSLFGYPGAGGFSVCNPQSPASGNGGGNITLDGLMTNLIMNIKDPIVTLISVTAIIIGVYLIINGLVKASKYGTDPKTYSVHSILANLIAGTCLFVIGQSLSTMLSTIFGVDGVAGFGVINWSNLGTGGSTAQFQAAVYAALTFVQIIGMIAFVRGFLILKSAVEGSGQATIAQGITHIVGGVLAINIYYFLLVMDTTFGTNLLS
jgi:intracellular multiplication protein IcmC